MESFSVSLQENLLVLLCYSEEHCKFIRNVAEIDHFDGILRDFAHRVYRYIDDYKEPPKDHIADLFEDILTDGEESKRSAYQRVLVSLIEAKDSISSKYTIDKLDKFVRLQNLKSGIMEAASKLQQGGEDAAEEAEVILQGRMKKRLTAFDPGLSLDNIEPILAKLKEQSETLPTGIRELDNVGLGPIIKGIHLFVAPPKAGKTTWLVQLGRSALMHGYRVCHVTLEMSEAHMAQRYLQAMCGIAKHPTDIRFPTFSVDQLGRIDGIEIKQIAPKVTFEDSDIDEKIIQKVSKWKRHQRRLLIKQFPTGQLSIRGLEAYLDRIEESLSFRPDLLILDYADLLQVKSVEHYRIALGEVYKQLRGIAVEREIAIATASQSNREGAKRRKVTETEVAEDFSKIATADCVVTYNQTPQERMLNLARVFVAAARHDMDKFEICISQNYAMAQFARDSVRLRGNYFELVDSLSESEAQ